MTLLDRIRAKSRESLAYKILAYFGLMTAISFAFTAAFVFILALVYFIDKYPVILLGFIALIITGNIARNLLER